MVLGVKWRDKTLWGLHLSEFHFLVGKVDILDLQTNPFIKVHSLIIVSAHIQIQIFGVFVEKVVHDLLANAESLALGPDSDSHEVAALLHLHGASIAYDGLGIALPGHDDLVALGLPEGLQNECLLINLPKGFPVHCE
eukprot:CAMPEP_0170541042 /NCGR_PEP_ID=MMETSP0211-20121228/893_1 /TAXON_ID=311385 /ORGANISM="Pseudokeronopsis sp., Strain OXSARD2" /LENGTH=137 /DNA_ID=CAMNT_0010843639 /DNA_START=378 /DNA_END=791 /DNA_ORIENTATION=-